MDFSLTPELQALQQRTRSFIREQIMPLEGDPRQTAHGPTEAFRRELVALGREAGLVAPHAAPEYGGLGLDNVGKAVVFEEAGYSLLGPVAMHIFAPDEGNIHLLEQVATPEQKDKLQAEFKTLLIRTYAGALTRVNASTTVDLKPSRGAAEGDDATVRTEIKGNGDPVEIDYRLEKMPSEWKIYDVNVLGVWLVDQYKSSFQQQIQQGGLDGLISTLQAKNKGASAPAK